MYVHDSLDRLLFRAIGYFLCMLINCLTFTVENVPFVAMNGKTRPSLSPFPTRSTHYNPISSLRIEKEMEVALQAAVKVVALINVIIVIIMITRMITVITIIINYFSDNIPW